MKKQYTCDKCDYSCDTVPEITSHKRRQHPKRKIAKVVEKTPNKKIPTIAKPVKRRKLRQEKSQHIPRPENFSLAGCGVEIYYDHLTFIPDFEDESMTVDYLVKERVCKKCRKRYKIDEALRKRKRSK